MKSTQTVKSDTYIGACVKAGTLKADIRAGGGHIISTTTTRKDGKYFASVEYMECPA